MTIEINCYLCEKFICSVLHIHSDRVICSDCIDKLEKEHAERVEEKHALQVRLDSFIHKYGSDLNQ